MDQFSPEPNIPAAGYPVAAAGTGPDQQRLGGWPAAPGTGDPLADSAFHEPARSGPRRKPPRWVVAVLVAAILASVGCVAVIAHRRAAASTPAPLLKSLPADALLDLRDLPEHGWKKPAVTTGLTKDNTTIQDVCGGFRKSTPLAGARDAVGMGTNNQTYIRGIDRARWVNETAQRYTGAQAAATAFQHLGTATRACPTQTSAPQGPMPDGQGDYAPYTLHNTVRDLRIGRWEGFRINRIRTTQVPAGASDEVTVALRRTNTLVIFKFGDLRNPPAPRSGFEPWWRGLVTRSLARLDAAYPAH